MDAGSLGLCVSSVCLVRSREELGAHYFNRLFTRKLGAVGLECVAGGSCVFVCG